MSQKIIFFDIDGTILSHRTFQISTSTKEAIQKARANGHLTFINTGRTISEIDNEIKDVGFDGYVCGCGTYINYNSSVLFHTTLSSDICQNIMQDLRRLKIDSVLEGSSAIYFDGHQNNPDLKIVHDMYRNLNFNVLCCDKNEVQFDKFCIWINSLEAVQIFQKKYEDIFDFIYRDGPFIEVIPKGYSKATGIEYLLTGLNIPHENAYALGDSANDFTMLSYVKNSIGMGNSEEQIKKIVSYITKDVDEDGVSHALKHFDII